MARFKTFLMLAAVASLAGCSKVDEVLNGPEMTASLSSDGGQVQLRNNESVALLLEKVVVNDQNGDSDCDIKLFTTIEPNESFTTSTLRCGQVQKVRAITDKGEAGFTWTPGERYSASRVQGFSGPELHFNNGSDAPVMVDKIIVNNQAADPDCDVKFFREVPAGSSAVFPLPSCGQIREVQIISGEKKIGFTFD